MMTSTNYISERCDEYRHYPKLGPEDELLLIHRWRETYDEMAYRRLIECNMRYVVALARRYHSYPVPYGDLLAEGSLGLLVAIEKFDPGKGVRLVTYAAYWIRAYIIQAIIREWKKGRTGIGTTRCKTYFKLQRLLTTHYSRYGSTREHLDEVAEDLEIGREKVDDLLDSLDMHDISMDSDGYKNEDGPRGMHDWMPSEHVGPEAEFASSEYQGWIEEALQHAFGCLNDRERYVLEARHLTDDPMTLAETGKKLGLTRERVRQIEVRAKEKLSRALRQQGVCVTN